LFSFEDVAESAVSRKYAGKTKLKVTTCGIVYIDVDVMVK